MNDRNLQSARLAIEVVIALLLVAVLVSMPNAERQLDYGAAADAISVALTGETGSWREGALTETRKELSEMRDDLAVMKRSLLAICHEYVGTPRFAVLPDRCGEREPDPYEGLSPAPLPSP